MSFSDPFQLCQCLKNLEKVLKPLGQGGEVPCKGGVRLVTLLCPQKGNFDFKCS